MSNAVIAAANVAFLAARRAGARPSTPLVTLSLAARIELEAANRAARRAHSRMRAPDQLFAAFDRRIGLRTRKSFREAVAILQAELVG